jgi:hypothetical protein
MQFPQNLFYGLIDLAPLSQTFPITIRQCMDFLVQTELCQPRKERSGGWLHPAMPFDGPVLQHPLSLSIAFKNEKKSSTLRLRNHGPRASRAGSKVSLKPDVIRLADPLGYHINSPDHSDQSAPVAMDDSWDRSSPMDRARDSHLDGFYS